ncbi:MAG: HD domain-containing protein [Solobacterium sp.]|nr:HD domain-containing protein [Solobacterium sp.]
MTKIKDFQEKDRYTQPLLIKSCNKGVTQKGAPYLNLVFQDSSGSIDGKLWDAKPEDEAVAIAGNVVEVNFEVLLYNHALQLRCNHLEALDQKSIDMSEFMISSRYSEEELRAKLKEKVDSIQNTTLRNLVEKMFDKVGDSFFAYPAASRIHHSYVGGLAEHTLGMAATAEEIIKLYPALNRDLLLSGVLIHDMGKTVELGGLMPGEYSDEGRLTGHISICHGWVMECAEELHVSKSEEALLLRHLVLSHHGKLEFGSPVMPLTMEAEVLNLIDNLDARMNTLTQALSTLSEGEWTQKMFALDGRQFYKPKL